MQPMRRKGEEYENADKTGRLMWLCGVPNVYLMSSRKSLGSVSSFTVDREWYKGGAALQLTVQRQNDTLKKIFEDGS